MKKGIRLFVITAIVIVALMVSCFAVKSYKDVPDNSWYSAAVAYVSEKGTMTGIGNNLFDPNGKVTRAQVAQILYALEGKPFSNTIMFPDAPSGKWFSSAVNWAGTYGIVSGYDNGNFGPNDPVTRQQLAAILYKYAGKKGYDTAANGDISKYSDVSKVSTYAVDPMKWAVGNKLISGTNIGLEPRGTATRAQLAVILQAFSKLSPKDDSSSQNDTPLVPFIGDNGNWWIGTTDTGIAAAGKDGKDGKNGADGQTPHIGDNGNWWIGDKDTGISASGKNGKDGKDGANGQNGLTPYIGDNGTWWIGTTDTKIAAAGKDGKDGKNGADGQTPRIGDNGNWWIGDKDTGVKAAAETTSLSNMKIGDKLEFLPRSNFSWKNSDGDTITYDSIELKLCAKDNFDEVSKDASKGFFYNIPEDSTYSDRVYWDQQGRYQAFVFRVEITGHVDKSFAGQMVNTVIQRTGETSPEYLYQGYVEDDGTFKVVFYQHNFDYGTYQFIEGKITEDLVLYPTGVKVLKRFDSQLQSVDFYIADYFGASKVLYSDLDKSIVLTLSGKDINGKDFTASQPLSKSSSDQVFKKVPVSGKNGYVLTARGVPNTSGEKIIKEKVFVIPDDVHDMMERYLSASQFVDNRTCKVTAQIEFADDEAAKMASSAYGTDVTITGTDINGIEQKYSARVFGKDTTEIDFGDMAFSGATPYTIGTNVPDVLYIASEDTIYINEEGEKTIKVVIASVTGSLKISVKTEDNAKESFSVRVNSRENGYDKTYTTDKDGNLELTVPVGHYTVYLLDIPERYKEHEDKAGAYVDKDGTSTAEFYLGGCNGTLVVSVDTEDGENKGFIVNVEDLNTGEVRGGKTDGKGCVEFSLPAGQYGISLYSVPGRYMYDSSSDAIKTKIIAGDTTKETIQVKLK